MKVTSGRSFSTSRAPMPRTSQSASIEPNGPAESRLATIRAASAGPIPGSDSMAAESARSRSMGAEGVATERGRFTCALPARGLRERGAARAESTRWSCRSSETTASGSTVGRLARHIRTVLPDKATRARNHSALRSFVVATPVSTWRSSAGEHRFAAVRTRSASTPWLHLNTSVNATSPTTCRLSALILSMVSSWV